ncbi:unnamed protein product, partial [Closterium sp. Naga37s-1]
MIPTVRTPDLALMDYGALLLTWTPGLEGGDMMRVARMQERMQEQRQQEEQQEGGGKRARKGKDSSPEPDEDSG